MEHPPNIHYCPWNVQHTKNRAASIFDTALRYIFGVELLTDHFLGLAVNHHDIYSVGKIICAGGCTGKGEHL